MSENKYVPVTSIKEYFKLPKDKREKWGFWYLKPIALSMDDFLDKKAKGGWGEFRKLIMNEYPIQGWIREWFFGWDNPIYAFIKIKIRQISDIKYNIECFFNPYHKRIRNALPKTFSDITGLILDLNFAMILDFYYEEVLDGPVDWTFDEQHKTFINWIKNVVNYIEVERPALEKENDKLWRAENGKKINKTFLNKMHKKENFIIEMDKRILKEMIDYKEMFWT